MAIAYRSQTNSLLQTVSATAVINTPAGAIDGDALVCFINTSNPAPAPAGWALLGTANAVTTYQRQALGTPASTTFTFPASQNFTFLMLAYSGGIYDSYVPVALGPNAGTVYTSPSATPTSSPGLFVAMVNTKFSDGNDFYAINSGVTSLRNNGHDGAESIGVGDAPYIGGSAVQGAFNATLPNTPYGAVTVLLRQSGLYVPAIML